MGASIGSECLSCAIEIDASSGKGVPTGVPVCKHCWSRIKVVDRIRISIAVKDRSVGGVLTEIAALVEAAFQAHIDDKADDDS